MATKIESLLTGRVTFESASRCKFTKLVADHVLRHVDRKKTPAVVDIEVQANKVWRDGRATRPGLDRLAIVVGLGDFDFFGKVRIDEESFFN